MACYSEHFFLQVGRPGSNKKAIFIDGGIHAREWISPATVIWIVDSVSCNINPFSDKINSQQDRNAIQYTIISDTLLCVRMLFSKSHERYGQEGISPKSNFVVCTMKRTSVSIQPM